MNKFTRLWVSLVSLTLFTVFSAFRFTGLPELGGAEKMYNNPGKVVKDATVVRNFTTRVLKNITRAAGFTGRTFNGNSNISLTVPGNMSFSNTPGTCGRVVTYAAPTAQANAVSVEFDYTGNIQTFTVPAGVTSITIKGIGADGGNSLSSGVNGGRGASLTGTFAVTPGQTIYMVVGQRGSDDFADFGLGAAGGGGGTYISATPFGTPSAVPLMVAGAGGGAAAIVDNNIHANANSVDGNYGVTGDGGDGALGTGGSGGEAGTNSGAGAGWLADGLSDINSGDLTGGLSQFGTNPFAGGSLFGVLYGGYGGGGSAGFVGGGGGGGYSGGGGGGDNGGGGGGGSFNGGTNPVNVPGVDGDDGAGGNGKVVITYGTSVTVTQIAGLPSGATFPVGVTTNTFQATDGVNTTTASFTVTVNDTEAPVLTAPSNITYTIPAGSSNCNAAAVNLGTPTVSDNCGANTPTNNAPSLFPLGTTTVTWSVTDIHGNPATATQQVTVVAPEIRIASASFVFSILNGSTSIDLATGTDFGTTNINNQVTRTYIIDNAGGTADLSVNSINIAGANPSFFTVGGITLPATIPAGQTTTFTVTYSASAGGTHNAIVQLNNNDCDESAYSFAIQGVTNQATTPITGNTSVCVSGTTQLANVTAGGTWSSANAAVATVDANGLVTAVSAGTANISYTMPGGTVQVTVTVNAAPTAAISANGPTTFCAGGSVTLTATGGASYLWSNGSTTSSITVSAAGTYSVVATSAEGCSSASVSSSVTVNPVPTAAISADGPTTFCAGGSVTLTATGGASYLWSNGATTSSITVSSGGVYSVVATSAEGCSSASVSSSVTVNPVPTAAISA
ncbi:beta strand repeat-containing protein, partial [Sediminibacterium goheungense]